MAKNTSVYLRSQIIYSVFVRNHSMEGTFAGVEKDLDRIRSLGTDIIWLMPVHPIGVQSKKGELGCPYAIRDYRAINPAYGTMDDFRRLVDEVHSRGMHCVIDVVYNHTSPDSWLVKNHPEWFYHKPDGSLGNRCGDWQDVVDLDYGKKDLWEYQIETLKMWASIVDGFRCDVASMVPVDFWMKAREEVESVRPGCIWLAETLEPSFLRSTRAQGIHTYSDGEVYQAFDMTYDYDVNPFYAEYTSGKIPLSRYAEALEQQESLYPSNYVKLRFLENHDQPRAKERIPDEQALVNWTAFLYFQKGTTLIYAGQEMENGQTPSLFDADPVDWHTGHDLSRLMQTLAGIKKEQVPVDTTFYTLMANNESNILTVLYETQTDVLAGVFSLQAQNGVVLLPVKDGRYQDLVTGKPVNITNGKLRCAGTPVIFRAPKKEGE